MFIQTFSTLCLKLSQDKVKSNKEEEMNLFSPFSFFSSNIFHHFSYYMATVGVSLFSFAYLLFIISISKSLKNENKMESDIIRNTFPKGKKREINM